MTTIENAKKNIQMLFPRIFSLITLISSIQLVQSTSIRFRTGKNETTSKVMSTQKEIITEVLKNIERISASLNNLVKTYEGYEVINTENPTEPKNKQRTVKIEKIPKSDQSSEIEFASIEIDFMQSFPNVYDIGSDSTSSKQELIHDNVNMESKIYQAFADLKDGENYDENYESIIIDGEYKDEPGVDKVGRQDVIGEIETTTQPKEVSIAPKNIETKPKVKKIKRIAPLINTEPRTNNKPSQIFVSTQTIQEFDPIKETTTVKQVTGGSEVLTPSPTQALERLKVNLPLPFKVEKAKITNNNSPSKVMRNLTMENNDSVKPEDEEDAEQLKEDFSEICLKVVVRKCFKACQKTHKNFCKRYRCGKFRATFKRRSKTACIKEFSTSAPKLRIGAKKKGLTNNKFLELTQMEYLAGVCLPHSRTRTRTRSSKKKTQDKYERACARVSSMRCESACKTSANAGCKKANCSEKVVKILGKGCRLNCGNYFHFIEKDEDEENDVGLLDINGGDENTTSTTENPNDEEKVNLTEVIFNPINDASIVGPYNYDASSVKYEVMDEPKAKELTTSNFFGSSFSLTETNVSTTEDTLKPLEMPGDNANPAQNNDAFAIVSPANDVPNAGKPYKVKNDVGNFKPKKVKPNEELHPLENLDFLYEDYKDVEKIRSRSPLRSKVETTTTDKFAPSGDLLDSDKSS